MSAYLVGRPAPYAERLLFDPPKGGTVDPDEAVLAPQVEQVKKTMKDMFGDDGLMRSRPGLSCCRALSLAAAVHVLPRGRGSRPDWSSGHGLSSLGWTASP